MIAYTVRRLLYAVPILIGINLLTFVLFFVINTPQDMARCCHLLFGIDRATPQQVLEGIEQCLGYEMIGNRCCMHWELFFVKATKQADQGTTSNSPGQ